MLREIRISFLVTVRRSRKYDNHTASPTPSVIRKLETNKLGWIFLDSKLIKDNRNNNKFLLTRPKLSWTEMVSVRGFGSS